MTSQLGQQICKMVRNAATAAGSCAQLHQAEGRIKQQHATAPLKQGGSAANMIARWQCSNQ